MNGWSYDYMLALDDANCEAVKKARNNVRSDIDALVNKLDKDSKVQALFDKYPKGEWRTLCNYVNWAYTESIDLKSEDVPDIEKLYTTCQDAGRIETKQFGSLESTLKSVSTNDLRKDMATRITQWLSKANPSANKVGDKKANLEGTAGSNDPLYYMYWTNEQLLSLIAQSIVNEDQLVVDNAQLLPLGPSSTIILEFSSDASVADGATTIKAYIDDQAV